MADSTTLAIDLHHKNEVEFDVNIMNFDGFDLPKVRLCVGGTQCESILNATRVETESNRWSVNVAPLKEFAEKPTSFRIEVIIDGYYFEAAAGDIIYEENRKVDIVSEAITTVPEQILEPLPEIIEESHPAVIDTIVETKIAVDDIAKRAFNAPQTVKLPKFPTPEEHARKKEVTKKVKDILATFGK